MRPLLTIALGLALAAQGCRTAQHAAGNSRTMEGRVADVGRSDGTLTLAVGNERKEILVAPEAEIRIDDFKATFEDLQEGQRVRASLDDRGGQKEGYRIQILDQGAAAPGDEVGRDVSDRGAPAPDRESSTR